MAEEIEVKAVAVQEKQKPELSRPLAKYLRDQYRLPYARMLELITHDPNRPPSKEAVQQLVTMAEMYHLPLTALAFIPTKTGGQPYVKAEGLLWRLHIDPRGLKSIRTEPVKIPDSQSGRIVFKATVEFFNGQSFEAYAALSRETEPDATTDNLFMKAETKAVRRAALRAVGIPYPIYEEFMEFSESEETRKNRQNGGTIDARRLEMQQRVKKFLGAVRELGLTVEEACSRLGVKSFVEVTDVDAAIEALRSGIHPEGGEM